MFLKIFSEILLVQETKRVIKKSMIYSVAFTCNSCEVAKQSSASGKLKERVPN